MITVKRKKLSFGKVNLKRYLGLPYSYNSASIPWWGSWMDHSKLAHVYRAGDGVQEDYVVLIAEPYQIHLEDLKQIQSLCEQYQLECTITSQADHNEGCVRIEVYRRYWK